jgi:hypothetical protein
MSRLSPRDRVILRTPSWLGDFVMAEPVVRALHAHHARAGTESRLAIAGPGRLLALFDDRFARVQRVPLGRDGREDPAAWRGRDLALLLNGSWRSAWTAFAA